ncbi:MAG: restriction endonuclease subunit S [Bacteroidales bacterium]|nr:restriction endonuclease subunit S [Bacteroidales bacterium]
MKTNIKHIANIQTGIFAKPIPEGQIVYLQAKHFNENGQLISSLHPDLKAENISDKHLLRHGDVLFAAKGTKNFAAWYESKNLPAVASTSFFVIRINDNFQDKIVPEFLTWYINQPISQKFLKGKAVGSSIVSISKSVLEEVEIPIPDLETQKAILKITQLRNLEKILKCQIESLKEKQIQQQIINVIK